MITDVTKASTMETLKQNDRALQTFARGLVELYDRDRDGDDYWTAFAFGDGSYADVNIWIDERLDSEVLKVTVYPVVPDGETGYGITDTKNFRTVYRQTIRTNYKRRNNK